MRTSPVTATYCLSTTRQRRLRAPYGTFESSREGGRSARRGASRRSGTDCPSISANPAAAIRLAGDKIGYFHIGESNRGYLGDGVIDFDRIFDALLDIGYDRDITFESFSSAVVDEGLSLACAIWRDTWTDNMPLAKHARAYIEMKMDEAQRRRSTNTRP